jgi:hypothetical protein
MMIYATLGSQPVNYIDPLIPLDRWCGSFHDGSAQAQEAMNRRVRKRILASRG